MGNGNDLLADEDLFVNGSGVICGDFYAKKYYGDGSGLINIQTPNNPIISYGTTYPESIPLHIGDFYIDIATKKLYFATGITSSNDWVLT